MEKAKSQHFLERSTINGKINVVSNDPKNTVDVFIHPIFVKNEKLRGSKKFCNEVESSFPINPAIKYIIT
jgi:hypothetical protein